MYQDIQKVGDAVKRTLAFFDIFNYSLTAFEIWKYLHAPGSGEVDFTTILNELKNPELEKKIDLAQAFYFLKNKSDNVDLRKERYLIADAKLRKAKKFAAYLSRLPGVRGVAVSNTLAMFNSEEGADIDLFIIGERNKIWSTRFWSLLPLQIFAKRPKPGRTRDKFCLSFFVDEDNLNLLPWKNQQDIYYVYWLATLLPIYDRGIFSDFWKQNKWLWEYLPNFAPARPSARLAVAPSWRLPLPAPERAMKKFQLKIMPQELKDSAGRAGTDVVIGDDVLKFHAQDRRDEFQREFEQKVEALF
ncbi:hypothetical protein KJ969_02315 [Patescibacteria group bacterium]|nr:hypothetical protein [Patescibacteria group bacterium]MBU1922298.1 hypothetical protein [Patescibacteria group bacterium]